MNDFPGVLCFGDQEKEVGAETVSFWGASPAAYGI
jgi:hypothetical protein